MILEGPSVKLPKFEGPLDLLLYLIRLEEIDIFDIPISEITRQYLSALDAMQMLNLETAGEFILMVAYLLHIKAQMLLPNPKSDEDDDPRHPLVQKLLEYHKFKIIGEELRRIEAVRADMFPRRFSPSIMGLEDIIKTEFSPYDLFKACRQLLEAKEENQPQVVDRPKISIEEVINSIIMILEAKGKLSFLELVEGTERYKLVAAFIAMLELARQRILILRQRRLFGTIILTSAVDAAGQ